MSDSEWPDLSKWQTGSSGGNAGYSGNPENDSPDATRIQSFSLPVEPREDKPEEQQDAAPDATRVQEIPPAPAAPAYGQTPPPNQYGTPPPNYQQPYPQPGPGGYQQPPYGPPPYGQSPYGPPPYGYGVPASPRTNGLAIASLICGIFGGFFGVAWIAALITGFIALKQTRERGENGRGMAIAGIVLGFLWVIGFILLIVAVAVAGSHSVTVRSNSY